MFERYQEFPIRNLSSWFSEMAEIAGKSTDGSSLPKLELLLRSGSIIRGHILKLQQSSHDQLLMVAGLKDQYNKSEITFLSASEVVALTLLEPEAYLQQYVLPAVSKSIGSLELKRAALELNKKINDFFDNEISLQVDAKEYPENARWEVLQVLEFLPQLMQQLTADELGKNLVNEKINSIEIAVSDRTHTSLEQGILKVQLSSPFTGTLNIEKERIKSEIGSLL